MNKILIILVVLLILALLGLGFLYVDQLNRIESERAQRATLVSESNSKLNNLQESLSQEKKRYQDEKQDLLLKLKQTLKDKEDAVEAIEALKDKISNEAKLSANANSDLDMLRAEVVKLRRDSQQGIATVREGFEKKKQGYEARILSLEASLDKTKKLFNESAERYHYNLGVLYAQNRDMDLAVEEFKVALGYNPDNANAHYNLGIIFDDYFKDKESARYHYRKFLELSPTSDDADSVREWLKVLDGDVSGRGKR